MPELESQQCMIAITVTNYYCFHADHMVRCLELLQRATTPRVSHFSASLVFGLHTGCSEDYNDHCTTVWTFLESCTLRCVVGSIFLPVYMHFLAKKIQRCLLVLYVGLLLYILGALSMLAIDLAGHLHSMKGLLIDFFFAIKGVFQLIYLVRWCFFPILLTVFGVGVT